MGSGRGGWKSEPGVSGWEDIPSSWVLSVMMMPFLWGNYLYRTTEPKFTKEACNDSSPPKTVMFWLQPGGQRVGDQLFNAFAHSEEKHEYVTSWRVDADPSRKDPDSIKHPLLILWVASSSSLLGFVCQFVGLCGLHGSIALYQLASTLCMAVIRALLRSRRLGWEQNRLKHLHRAVEGHELDWQALNIESPHGEDRQLRTSSHGKCSQRWKQLR
jgi:hypothetical protein